MPAHVFFRPDVDVVVSEAEIRARLSDVLGETGITVSLILDESGNPVEAEVEVPIDANVRHIARLFAAFRSMDWDSVIEFR